MLNHLRTARSRRDDGVALVMAIMTGMFAVALALVVTSTVIAASKNSGRERQRAVAVSAAEAGVDASYATLQAATAAGLPCSLSVTSKASDVTTVTSTLRYFDGTGALVACSSGFVPAANAANVAKAEIVSTALTKSGSGAMKATRTMESLATIKPVLNATLSDALFSSSDMRFATGGRVIGANGLDANAYSNNQIICDNGDNSRFDGSFVAQGNVSVAAKCQIMGDLWAKGNVTLNNNGAYIGGYVRSGGTITAVPEATTTMVAKLAEAPNVSWDTCWTTSARTVLRSPSRCSWTTPADPPSKPFPIIRGDSTAQAAWAAAGYTVKVITSSSSAAVGVDCNTAGANGLNGVTNWLVQNAKTWTAKTMVVNTCTAQSIQLQNNYKIDLKGDLAIFSYGGFTVQGGGYGIASGYVAPAGVTGPTLHLVLPYDAVPGTGCSWQQGMTFNNNTIDSRLVTLIYSPCQVDVANSTTLTGQIYSGSALNVNNALTLQFQQVPMPSGSIIAPGGSVTSFTVGVVYKRESQG